MEIMASSLRCFNLLVLRLDGSGTMKLAERVQLYWHNYFWPRPSGGRKRGHPVYLTYLWRSC